jgi:molybdopterin-guanine dinucleotide biosynthesis protein A
MNKKYSIEVVILAGGLSSRMGKEKAQLRFGRRTLLGHARALAAELGLPCRVLRVDRLPGRGPLGGIETALHRAKADRVLLLSCDMPFLQPNLVGQLLAVDAPAVFVSVHGKVGFPFCLSRKILPKVEVQLAAGQLSLQDFALKIRARRLRVPKSYLPQLDNLNTPSELASARARLH